MSFVYNASTKGKSSGMGFKMKLIFLCVIGVGGYYASDYVVSAISDKSIKQHIVEIAKAYMSEKKQEVKSAVRESIIKTSKEDGAFSEVALFITKYALTPSSEGTKLYTHKTSPSSSSGSNSAAPALKSMSQAQRDFTQRHLESAQRVQEKMLIPASFLIGQAGHETAWGQREIKFSDGTLSYNLFGIKPGANWNGKVVRITTTEYVKGVAVKKVEPFRAYNSYEESFTDYARLISTSARYADAKRIANEFAIALQKGGYATDPNYGSKLGNIITNTHNQVAANNAKKVSP